MNAVRHDRPRQPLRGHRVLPRVQGRPASTRSSATRRTSPPASAPSARPRSRGEAGYPPDAARQERTRASRTSSRWRRSPSSKAIYYVPRIDKEMLEAHNEGLICLSAAARPASSASYILKDQHGRGDEAGRVVRTSVFGKNFYVEIQNNGLDIQKQCAEGAIDIANRLGLPLVATSDAHYLCAGRRRRPRRAAVHQHRQDARATRTAMRVRQRPVLRPQPRRRCTGSSPSHDEAVKRSQEIADGVRHRARLQEAALPRLHAAAKARRPRTTCASCARQGLNERYGDNPPRGGARPARARAGHHLPDGLRQLLPDRLGLRPLRPRERHPRPAPAARPAGPSSATCSS